MIKKLRLKFVCIVMSIAMLMVLGILGVVVYFTAKNMEMQSISMMRTLSSAPFQMGAPGKRPNDEVRLPFFTVQVGNRGDVMVTSSGYFDLSNEEDLLRMVEASMDAASNSGTLQEYGLRYLKINSPRGVTIVFADTATEVATLKSLVYSCLFIFFAAMLVFLGLSILLSRWAIKPVALAWDQQRQFVADASHELKTPLAVIMANAELLQNGDTPTEDAQKFSGNILSTSYQMRSLVENMLEMARVDNGTVKMEFASLDMSQLVNDAVLSFQLLYEEKNMGLTYQISGGHFHPRQRAAFVPADGCAAG